MKKRPKATDPANDFIDTVHSTELEIDAFLKDKEEEARRIVNEAVTKRDGSLEEARREADERAGELTNTLLAQAEKEARETVQRARPTVPDSDDSREEQLGRGAELIVRRALGEEP